MTGKVLTCGILLVISWACSPANTTITANPKKAGFKRNESILIMPLPQIKEQENEQMMVWANQQVKDKQPALRTMNYWDVQYKSRQHGFVLPSFNQYDTVNFEKLNQTLGVDFILAPTLNSLNENYLNELSNPNHQKREAIVSFQLIDLKNKAISWHCTTRVIANPFEVKGKTQEYSVNVLSGSFAVQKAYKESINRLIKSMVLIQ
jgi:hypothetical protein